MDSHKVILNLFPNFLPKLSEFVQTNHSLIFVGSFFVISILYVTLTKYSDIEDEDNEQQQIKEEKQQQENYTSLRLNNIDCNLNILSSLIFELRREQEAIKKSIKNLEKILENSSDE